MTYVRRFPLVLAPAEDESLQSWVARMAATYEVPSSRMLSALGFSDVDVGRSSVTRVIGYGTILSRAQRNALQHATGLAGPTIDAMLLSRYDGVAADLSGLNHEDPLTFPRVAIRQWLLFASTRLCPQCLRERAGAWSIRWRLSWVFACTRHQCLLLDRCPDCGRAIGSGKGDSCLPHYLSEVPVPLRCQNSPEAHRPRRSRVSCGFLLTDAVCVGLAGFVQLDGQEAFERVLADGHAVVAGEAVSSVEYFLEARGLYAMLMAECRTADFPDLPPAVTDELDSFFRIRDERRSSGEKRAVMYKRKPGVFVTAAIAAKVADVLASGSMEEASTRLSDVAALSHARLNRVSPASYYHLGPRMNVAALSAMPDRNSRVWRKKELVLSAARVGPPPDDIARKIPPIIWPDVWEERFAPLLPAPDDWGPRRILSMMLLKLETQCTWKRAAAALGHTEEANRVGNSFVTRTRREGTAEAVRAAADATLRALAAVTVPVDYRKRRAAFIDLAGIEDSVWQGVLAVTGLYHGSTRQSFAAVWLWSELTGGYPLAAPAWSGTPSYARHMYRAFLRHQLPLLRAPLLELGRDLLRHVGDAQPDQVEFRLGRCPV